MGWVVVPYNQHMKPPVFIDGHVPGRKLVISARKSIVNENFRVHPDHLASSAARRDEAPAPLPRFVERWH